MTEPSGSMWGYGVPKMTEPRTAAGRALLADLTMGYEDAPGDVVMPAVKEGMARDILAIEAEATQAEHERAVDACARMVIVEKAKARAAALDAHRPGIVADEDDTDWRIVCSCGWDGPWTNAGHAAIDALREVKNDQ